jgi:DNA-binding transcriptional ArsR family regulator
LASFRHFQIPPADLGFVSSSVGFVWYAPPAPAIGFVSSKRPSPPPPSLAYIRYLEYTETVPNQLRAYKASVFQALAHPTRIAILEILRDGPLSAGAMQEKLGVEQANLSQHLAVLRGKQIVVNRKEGNQVFYSLGSPLLVEVLDTMRRYCLEHLNEAIQMLDEVNREASR